MASEERKDESAMTAKECEHETKLIQFLGRTTPIVLQNDNGPCPLIAICNVLLLKNNLNLSADTGRVSQEKLLSLVADKLIDSNSNVNNKDSEYVENQQQNIADAIDLLPRLATGIDVNIKFRRIDDFEFTRECAIFDLLDIPLYHGWIVDPQDYDTASAIGSKSYNTLMGELVALETQNMEGESRNSFDNNSVDFVAATTATLGVPSPNFSRVVSFDDSPCSVSGDQKVGKGDMEEEEKLFRALKLSEGDIPSLSDASLAVGTNEESTPVCSRESTPFGIMETINGQDSAENQNFVGKGDMEEEEKLFRALKLSVGDIPTSSDASPAVGTNEESTPVCSWESTPLDTMGTINGQDSAENQNFDQPEQIVSGNSNYSIIENKVLSEILPTEPVSTSPMIDGGHDLNQLNSKDSEVCFQSIIVTNSLGHNESEPSPFDMSDTIFAVENQATGSGGNELGLRQSSSSSDINEPIANQTGTDYAEVSSISLSDTDCASSGNFNHQEPDAAFTSSVDDSEPMYEGEECMLDSGVTVYENLEPMYEGEAVLAEQADTGTLDASNVRNSKDELTPYLGELIRGFLKNNASQLTINGLFCLQDGLKERELCVFFRNNHFSTMFKFEGELYLLATDQGYINQSDLVWEKLNEVNGNTAFMTGNFKEFKLENHTNETWDEQNAMTSTADYLATIDRSTDSASNFNSDLQLAMALQQQEFDQQAQQNNPPQPSNVGSSGLVTGPQVSRSRPTPCHPPKQASKSKDMCSVM